MKKKIMYKYSIIMPVYNSENSLAKSIECIINQNYNNWELIIVDDGSTDSSKNIIKKYVESDSRIVLKSQKNAGPGAARNNGIEIASGDYIAFLDSDDYYDKDFLSTVNNKNNEFNYDLLFISTINETKNGKVFFYDNLIKYSRCDKNEIIGLQLAGILPWGPCSKVVRNDIVKQCKFSNFEVGEESIYSYNIMQKVNNFCFIDKPLYHYVHTESGQHKKGGYDPWKNIVDSVKEKLLNDNNFNIFEKYYNCLVLKAFSIYIYRYSYSNKILDSIKNIKNKHKKYYENLRNIDTSILDNKTRIILYLLKFKLYFALVIMSKVKYLIQNMEEKVHG